jgi:molybdopterin converting factor small subunit
MAKVAVRVTGQEVRDVEGATTVGALKTSLGLSGYSASVNREPASDAQVLSDEDYVTLAPNVKGGC